jgi:hypothetical protein
MMMMVMMMMMMNDWGWGLLVLYHLDLVTDIMTLRVNDLGLCVLRCSTLLFVFLRTHVCIPDSLASNILASCSFSLCFWSTTDFVTNPTLLYPFWWWSRSSRLRKLLFILLLRLLSSSISCLSRSFVCHCNSSVFLHPHLILLTYFTDFVFGFTFLSTC